MSNTLEAQFTFTAEKAGIIADSLKLESKTAGNERSKTTIASSGDKLTLEIQAEDLHALRAAVNTYLKWLIMCSELVE